MELIVASHLALENWAFLGYLNFSKILKKCWLVYQMKLWRPLIIPHYRPHRHGSCGGEARIGTDWIYSISTHIDSWWRPKGPYKSPKSQAFRGSIPSYIVLIFVTFRKRTVRKAGFLRDHDPCLHHTLEDIYKTMRDSKSQLKTMPQRASFSA